MNGILLIDKPSGMTSHDVVARIRRIVNLSTYQLGQLSKLATKVGHGGTLDPIATGVLPILIGDATRLSERVMRGDKEYIAKVRLGKTTDTDDSDGRVLASRPVPEGVKEEIAKILPRFLGKISQVPPVYSAIKKGGRPLYKWARDGVKVEVTPRVVEIKDLRVLDIKLPFIDLVVKCSKGTYIRALARDLGEALGCGGHVVELRRVACGEFGIGESMDLNKISTLQDVISMLRTPELF